LLAARLDEGHQARSDLELVLPIRPRGGRQPLFCIHPAAGLSWSYSRLISHIPIGHPIYGLQARKLAQPEVSPRDIAGMAADYLAAVREIQPGGPYNLLGWSFGGLVAHAMATQLQSMGEEVSLLALLDSYPPNGEMPLNGDDSERYEESLSAMHDGSLRAMLKGLSRDGHVLTPLAEGDYQAVKDAFAQNARIVSTFSPDRFDGDILLFVAATRDTEPPIDTWRAHVDGRMHVHAIDCTHDAMMDAEPAEQIGKIVAAQLDNQQTTKRLLLQLRTK
jgi:nonribosomal peptide synthetase DhbF